MVKLKNCPFCGLPSELYKRKDCFRRYGEIPIVGFIPRCSDAQCIGRIQKAYRTEEEAAQKWNHRKGE